MTLIGLTGGIASGKSTIGRRLEALGAVRIDADQLAREAVEPGTEGLAQIVRRFGRGVTLPDGSLDRAALGAHVFGEPGELAALNGIVHPAVRRLAAERIAEAERADAGTGNDTDAGTDAVVVYEVPLLVEAGVEMPWDLIVVAEAPDAARVERLVRLRGMDEVDARRRVESQASNEERRAIADVVIDTGGSEADTLTQVDALWKRLQPNR